MKLNEVIFSFEETFGDLMLIGTPKEVFRYVDGKKTEELEATDIQLFHQTMGKIYYKSKRKISLCHF